MLEMEGMETKERTGVTRAVAKERFDVDVGVVDVDERQNDQANERTNERIKTWICTVERPSVLDGRDGL